MNLIWKQTGEKVRMAQLGTDKDGVEFCLSYHPTCYRRGPWRLLVEVYHGQHHHAWGCFDEADQPMRYYHHEEAALREAQAIADVLWKDRTQIQPLPGKSVKIVDVEFYKENHTYVYFGKDGNPDVIIAQQDKDSWDVYIHEKMTADILDQHTFENKEDCVKWAKIKRYIPC